MKDEKTQHTPGPWKIDNAEPRIVYSEIDNGVISNHNPYRSASESEANARLISSAPELLMDLKFATNLLNHTGVIEHILSHSREEEKDGHEDALIGALKRFAETIAKAEGK